MVSEPIVSVKRAISIDTMVNFDGDGDGHGNSDGTCKQAIMVHFYWKTRFMPRVLQVNLEKILLCWMYFCFQNVKAVGDPGIPRRRSDRRIIGRFFPENCRKKIGMRGGRALLKAPYDRLWKGHIFNFREISVRQTERFTL